jgi:hypothetical protein
MLRKASCAPISICDFFQSNLKKKYPPPGTLGTKYPLNNLVLLVDGGSATRFQSGYILPYYVTVSRPFREMNQPIFLPYTYPLRKTRRVRIKMVCESPHVKLMLSYIWSRLRALGSTIRPPRPLHSESGVGVSGRTVGQIPLHRLVRKWSDNTKLNYKVKIF